MKHKLLTAVLCAHVLATVALIVYQKKQSAVTVPRLEVSTHVLQPQPKPKPVVVAPKPKPVVAAPKPNVVKEKSVPKPEPVAESQRDTQKIASLVQQSLKQISTPKVNYEALLSEHLKQLLKLPEKGEVNVQLKLAKDGSVQELKVLSASSMRNRDYVQAKLPTLLLPPPMGSGRTFNLNLKS